MVNLPHKHSFAERLYCLKTGKHTSQQTDQAQQESTREDEQFRKKDLLRCVQCFFPIAHKTDRLVVNEKHQHVFANPHGYIYQIGCFAQAPGCIALGQESSQFSWFPGYTWQVVVCGQCLTLLGWTFRSGESRFYGLIVEKLTEDTIH